MNKIIVTIVCFIFTSVVFSQKMMTRSGEIKFDATVPGALDPVIATNKTVSSIFQLQRFAELVNLFNFQQSNQLWEII